MILLHQRLAVAATLYALVLGVWGVVSFFRGRGVTPNYRGALVIGEGLLAAQALLGLLLLLLGYRPAEILHLLYGVLIPLVLPFTSGVVRGRSGRTRSLYYGGAALFIVGLAIRATVTGG